MKICISVLDNRIAPVFDVSRSFLLLDLSDGKTLNKGELFLKETDINERIRQLKKHDVNTIICGAVSRQLLTSVDLSGINLIPWISGQVDEVIKAYRENRLENASFFMPGCHTGCRRQFRRRQCRRF